MDFLRKVLRLDSTDVTSFCKQQVKVGCGLMREACQGEGEGGSPYIIERKGKGRLFLAFVFAT